MTCRSRKGDERLLALIELYKERIQTFGDLEEQTRYFFTDPSSWGPPKALKKHLREPGQRLLRLAGERLKQLDTWSLEGLEQCLSELVAEEAEGKMGKVAQPLRIAVTGTPVSPPIFDTLFWLGRDACLRRIESCLEALSQ